MSVRKSFHVSAVLGICLFIAVLGTSIDAQDDGDQPRRLLTSHDLEFYVSPLLVDFVRAGLTVELSNASISGAGQLSVDVRIADNKGLPLDRNGIFTPGTVSMSFIAARLPSESDTYVAYTTRTATSSITGLTAIQGGTDTGGTYVQLGDGLYRYTFGTNLPAAYPTDQTHTIGVYATRDLREFDLDRQYFNDLLQWVPNGSQVRVTRDRVSTAACNTCHDPLALHGGGRDVKSVSASCVIPNRPPTRIRATPWTSR
jgi:hypothetical protein